ncbi:tetratricopeptide repeat protein [Microcystis sp. M158S2]|uniref:tetratricopeptide repeat protein n=1 Tax=Microcystis sp. M158S2 TaxID=2771152 RepID=UPI00258ACE34|nr:tetratricopeptide repeat protein [Microcystis sp. M158S2]MCA2736696.1 tetratricopeptide repeat protein [Microcystis sp. M158S2]
MKNQNDLPIKKFQNFVDATLGDEMSQGLENLHADRLLEAIEQARMGSYAEASVSFAMCSGTTLVQSHRQYCQNFAQLAIDAHNKYENALSNAAPEDRARKIAKSIWIKSYEELSAYLGFLALGFHERGNYDAALRLFDKALEIDPTDTNIYICRGNLKGEMGSNKKDSHLIDEAIQDLDMASGLFLAHNDQINYTRMNTIIGSYTIVRDVMNGVKAPNLDNTEKGWTKKMIEIDSETKILRVLAILIFLIKLGIINKHLWRISVIWLYCKQVITRVDGKSRGLFNSMDDFSDFIRSVESRNGGKFPIVDNFWFSFLGRLTIWGLILFATIKFIGIFIK